MAARTTSKAKQAAGSSRASAKTPAAKKVTARKASAKSRKSKVAKKPGAGKLKKRPADAMSVELLVEQNAALRGELEQAQARIAELEELNKNVVNRIDWVIDSLQSALKR